LVQRDEEITFEHNLPVSQQNIFDRSAVQVCPITGNPYIKGSSSTFDLLVLTSLDQLILKTLFSVLQNFLIYKTSYLNEEVNRTEASPSVGVPCLTSSKP